MENKFLHHQMNADEYTDKIEELYPDVYKKMIPHVEEAISTVANTYELTEEDVDRMAYQVVRNSNVSADPPRGHNENTMGDAARAMILSGLCDQCCDDDNDDDPPFPFPFFPPFYFYPFGGFFGRRRPGRFGGPRGGRRMGRR